MSADVIRLKPAQRSKESRQQKAFKHLGNLPDIDADLMVGVRAFVNHIVREYVMNGGRMNALSLKAGLSFNTISRLAYYETTRPQGHTIMAVIIALGKLRAYHELVGRYIDQYEGK